MRRWSGRCPRELKWMQDEARSDSHCEAGEFEAELTNLSSDGFRLHSDGPLQVGWEVTLEAAKNFPVKAMICWACGNESGGVFSEAVAL